MFSRYNKAVEAAIGQVLVVGMVVLGFVQDLPPGVVIGATVGLALLTVFKVYWVSNGPGERESAAPVTETRQRRVVQTDVVAEELVHDPAALADSRVSRSESRVSESRTAESWRDDGPGRHQRTRSSYRAVTEVAPAGPERFATVAPRAVARRREEAAEI